ncbi:MAG: fibronectin type III domain-containing protein [Candidatus Liptonbacteria bacterium]|nr:fibronectin type III domain-containing protein [Candidatus Liptonbacteria bacterium]
MKLPTTHYSLLTRRGFSPVEVILAGSILALIVTAIVGALVYGREGTQVSGSRARAIFLADEGLEALRNMRDESFTNLTDGPHGLVTSGSQWVFSGVEDVTDIFTRQIQIGTIDSTTKQITSTVTWQQNPQRQGSVSLGTRLTNWKIIAGFQADSLSVNTSAADVDSTDNTHVIGVTIDNLGVTDITITHMTVSWSGVSGATRLNGITINGTQVFSGNSNSGTLLDIADFTLTAGAGSYPINFFDFNRNMTNSTLTVVFTMADGSTKEVTFSPGAVPPDTTPPAAITNLAVSNVTSNSTDLSWTAPGDDDNTGTATSYDVRYSTAPITDATWSSATQVTGEPAPAPAGTAQSMTVTSLSPSTTYYFAIRTADEVPNISSLSNIPSVTTLTPAQADSLLVDTSAVNINPSDNTQVIGITLENTGTSNITITQMTVSWSGVSGGTRLNGITIGGTQVFSGNSNSGTLLDITDFTLTAGAGIYQLNNLDFNRRITGITLSITFTMADGSTKTVSGITP